MLAYFINAFTETITPINIPDRENATSRAERQGLLQSFLGGNYEVVTWDITPKDNFCLQNDLYVNEEFLFQGWSKGFSFKDHTTIDVLGFGIVVGHDGKGGSQDASVNLGTLKYKIRWGYKR